MKLKTLLLLIAVLITHAVHSQSADQISASFAKVLTAYRDSLSRYNYNSMVNILDESGKNTISTLQMKGTSWDRISQTLNKDEKAEDLLYVFPKPLKTSLSPEKLVVLEFPIGGFTIISKQNIEKRLSYRGDTIIYTTDSAPRPDGTFGVAIRPANHYQLSYAWSLPESFEVLSYKCNRSGQWQNQHNFLHFIGVKGDNNFVFEIRFRRKQQLRQKLLDRTVSYSQSLVIKSDTVELVIKDPQVLDGDIISLHLNDEWVIRGFEVSKARTRLRVPVTRKENYLILHAENIGRIPPNTAELEIIDGKTTHMILLNSDKGKSEGILLVR